MILVYLLCAVVLIETGLTAVVRYFRREFQWLITEADEHPRLDPKGLQKFFRHGYDAYAGWTRKPDTTGVEKGRCGSVTYKIDAKGARFNPLAPPGAEDLVATFGDSYTFCRQVNDDETWQAYLAKRLNGGVLNYGVGNYGVDQALLRYEKTGLDPSVKVVVLEFVPETICRIQSYWKHYLEFGNTFAFKPRFALEGERLAFYSNAMQRESDFSRLRELLPHIQKRDGFYNSKFRSLQFRFPYSVSFMRHPKRNLGLLSSLIARKLCRRLKVNSPQTENAPFSLVMKFNIGQAHKMYSMTGPRELLRSILMRFKAEALKRGHRPVIMLMPQLIDLKAVNGRRAPYADFLSGLNREMPVIDLTEFLSERGAEHLYTEDLYGGHFSKEGNEAVGEYLFNELRGLFPAELGREARSEVNI